MSLPKTTKGSKLLARKRKLQREFLQQAKAEGLSTVTIRTKTDTHSHQVTCSSRIQNRQSFASPPPRRDLLSLGRRQSEYPSGPLLPLSIQYLQLIEAL